MYKRSPTHPDLEFSRTIYAGYAHDINNMLGTIQIFCDLVSERINISDDVTARLLGQLSATIESTGEIVDQMLNWSQLEKNLTPIDLVEVVRDYLPILQVSTSNKLKLLVDDNDDDCIVLANPTIVQQILANLCSNANDAIGCLETGHVVISVKSTCANIVTLSVVDNGPGISKDKIDRIFDPYFSTKGEGAGLGLWMVKKFVERIDGSISVESRKGSGTRMDIQLSSMSS